MLVASVVLMDHFISESGHKGTILQRNYMSCNSFAKFNGKKKSHKMTVVISKSMS